jgi:hypothetical protein
MIVCWHLTCGHTCASLDEHDAHVAACTAVPATYQARAYGRRCPTCQAPPGQPCLTSGGRWVGAHGPRNPARDRARLPQLAAAG